MEGLKIICKGLAVEGNTIRPRLVMAEKTPEDGTALNEGIFNRLLLLEKAEHQLQGQQDRGSHVDTKTGIILGFTLVAMAQVLLAVGRVTGDEIRLYKTHTPLLYVIVFLFVIALAATLWATSFGLLALEPRIVKFLSVKDELRDPDRPTKELLCSCIRGLASAMDSNSESHTMKLKQSRYAAYGVGVSLVCYVGIAATVLLMLLLQ